MARILIPDYPGQQVVAGIKSLALDGDICDLAWDLRRLDRTFKSRYINQLIRIPSAEDDPKGYIEGLLRQLEKQPYDLILPFGNNACHQIVLAQEDIKKTTKILFPSISDHLKAFDKSLTYSHCIENDIPVPKTISVGDIPNINHIFEQFELPIVIKTKSGSGVKSGVRFVEKPDEFEQKFFEVYDYFASHYKKDDYKPIIQEFIPGYIHDACIVAKDGELVAFLSQIRHLMYPVSGGVGAINYTTHDDELRAIVERLIKSLNWSGPAQIEFKFDERDDQFKLIEINPKLWGTLDLSIQSGVSFPRIIRNLILERDQGNLHYDTDNYYFFLFPQAILAGVEKARLLGLKSLKIPQKVGKRFYDIDFSDPLPLFLRIMKTLAKLIHQIFSSKKTALGRKFINP